jgi:hypothetical protein
VSGHIRLSAFRSPLHCYSDSEVARAMWARRQAAREPLTGARREREIYRERKVAACRTMERRNSGDVAAESCRTTFFRLLSSAF